MRQFNGVVIISAVLRLSEKIGGWAREFTMDGADGQVTLRSICHSEGVRNSSVDEGSRRIEKSPPVRGIYMRRLAMYTFFFFLPCKDLVASNINKKKGETQFIDVVEHKGSPRQLDLQQRKIDAKKNNVYATSWSDCK